MAVSTTSICNAWHSAPPHCRGLLYPLVWDSLAPREREALLLVEAQPEISSMSVANAMKIQQNNADGVLKRLYRWHLLKRTYQESGHFTWSLADGF